MALVLERRKIACGFADRFPKGVVLHTGAQVTHNQAEQARVVRAAAQGAIHGDGAVGGLAQPGIDGSRVGVTPWVALESAAKPFGCTREAVEIRVADDGVDAACTLYQLGCDEFGAGALLCLRGKHEARIVTKALVLGVVVVIDPSYEARAQTQDEREGDLGETTTGSLGRERQVEHNNPAGEVTVARELSR